MRKISPEKANLIPSRNYISNEISNLRAVKSPLLREKFKMTSKLYVPFLNVKAPSTGLVDNVLNYSM
jgi:hypothetical protein